MVAWRNNQVMKAEAGGVKAMQKYVAEGLGPAEEGLGLVLSSLIAGQSAMGAEQLFQKLAEQKKGGTRLEREFYGAGLEVSIKEVGCLDPLKVWDNGEGNVLIDGHNRYEICQKHGIAFEMVYVELEDRDEAYNWIIDHQLHRRNLTPQRQSYYRGKKYNREKQSHGGDRKSSVERQHLNNKGRTGKKLAKHHHVSEDTIKKDGQFAAAVDTIAENVGPEAKRDILAGKSKLKSKKAVVEVAKLPEEEMKRLQQGQKNKSAPGVPLSPYSLPDK